MLEVVEHGIIIIPSPFEPTRHTVLRVVCMCCCMRCPSGLCFGCCCHQRSVVLMPFEKYFYCCSNRVGCCDNFCGLWYATCWASTRSLVFCSGDVTGNPKIFKGFEPQPKDPVMFVAHAQSVMNLVPPPGQQAIAHVPQQVPQHSQIPPPPTQTI